MSRRFIELLVAAFANTKAMDYRLWLGISALLAGVIVAFINVAQGDVVFATIVLGAIAVLFPALIWLTQPSRSGPHISHAAAQAAERDHGIIIYWRPGCVFCDRLKLGLGRDRHHVSWVNIARDTEAAEYVAAHHNGDEQVPTAATGPGTLIEATPAAIRVHLQQARSESHS